MVKESPGFGKQSLNLKFIIPTYCVILCDRMLIVNKNIATKNKNFSLHGYTFDNEGDKWKITFTLVSLKRGHRAIARAKCVTKRASILDARKDSSQILNLWPIEFWPEFAKPLAYLNATGNDGSIQEGLFNV